MEKGNGSGRPLSTEAAVVEKEPFSTSAEDAKPAKCSAIQVKFNANLIAFCEQTPELR